MLTQSNRGQQGRDPAIQLPWRQELCDSARFSVTDIRYSHSHSLTSTPLQGFPFIPCGLDVNGAGDELTLVVMPHGHGRISVWDRRDVDTRYSFSFQLVQVLLLFSLMPSLPAIYVVQVIRRATQYSRYELMIDVPIPRVGY